jgi:nicotinamide-nucleotide amidase
VAEYLGLPLREDATVIEAIDARLKRRGIAFRERMKRQAMVPLGATVLPNDNGSAPGLYIPARRSPSSSTPHFILLPGPPRELKPMFENYAVPILRGLNTGAAAAHECRVYHIVGMGESTVEEVVGLSLEKRGDLEVGYCARPNEVDFRLIGPTAILDEVEPGVLSVLGSHLVSRGNESLEEVVVKKLIDLGQTVATAESCTGGLLSHRLTNVAGASRVLMAGYVTYSNEAKVAAIGVDPALIAEHGAVSEPVARAMAEGARRTAGTHFGFGITGIAGPTGDTPDKPLGLVYIALAEDGQETVCEREIFPTDRQTFKELVTQSALDLLRLRLATRASAGLAR